MPPHEALAPSEFLFVLQQAEGGAWGIEALTPAVDGFTGHTS